MNPFSVIKNIYKKLLAPVFLRVAYIEPRKVVVITTSLNGQDNLFPLDWHIPLSVKPKRYAISVWKTNTSLKIIETSNVFAVNFMPAIYEEKILHAGSMHGTVQDKFSILGFQKKKCQKIQCCFLGEALAHLECKVEHKIDVGDHVLFIATVVKSSLKKDGQLYLYHLTNLSSRPKVS